MSNVVIRGAREHNLAGIDLDLPRDRLIVFTGVSGSGKSSLAFDTLHVEGQRRYLEALAANVRGLAGKLRRPEVDVVLGLPPTVGLDQRAPAPSSRSTVGTLSDTVPLLRVLFARAGEQHCPRCDARIRPKTHDEIVAALLRHPMGTRLVLEAPVRLAQSSAAEAVLAEIVRAGFSRVRLDSEISRVEDVNAAILARARVLRIVVDRIRLESDRVDRLHDAVRTTARAGHGVVVASTDTGEETFTDRPYCQACDLLLPSLTPGLMSHNAEGACGACHGKGVDAEAGEKCSACGGTRLNDAARAVRWEGWTLPQLLEQPLERCRASLGAVEPGPVTAVPLEELGRRLGTLLELGLGRLTLDRPAHLVSSGEHQRLRLARQVGAALSGVLYVLDEPSAGLHPDDVQRVVAVLRRLRDLGNSVIAVDHHREVVEAADLVVDFGPGAGRSGGRIVFIGAPAELLRADTATGRWLSGREGLGARPPRTPTPTCKIRQLRLPDGREISVELPFEAIGALVGPSGSGKTAVLDAIRGHLRARLEGDRSFLPPVDAMDGLERVNRLVEVARAPLGRSGRSTPATYTGMWDVVRELLASTHEARVRGMDASFFSLNAKGGRCEACQGAGTRRVELGILPDVHVPCDVCDGRRFNADVLEIAWKGRSADELLAMSADEARPLLAGHPRIDVVLRAIQDVGLGYVELGQAAHTLSGGEAQRLRLARELARAARAGGVGTLFLVDDPTVGLHPADVAVLLGLFRRLVEEGATVWLATHDIALAAACDTQLEL